MIGLLSAKVWGSIIGVGVLAAAGYFLVHTIERAALAEAEIESYKTVLENQNQAILDYEARLLEHQRKVRAANEELSTWKQKWKDIQDQPEVAEWVHTPVPEPVRERLLDIIQPPGNSDPFGGSFTDGDPVALLFIEHQRRPGGVSG